MIPNIEKKLQNFSKLIFPARGIALHHHERQQAMRRRIVHEAVRTLAAYKCFVQCLEAASNLFTVGALNLFIDPNNLIADYLNLAFCTSYLNLLVHFYVVDFLFILVFEAIY